MKIKSLALLFILLFGVIYGQESEYKLAKKLFKNSDVEGAYTQILEAEKKVKEAKLGSIDDEDVSDIFYLKFQIENSKRNTQGIIDVIKLLKEFEEGTNYYAENKTTGKKEYFLTKKEMEDAISQGTHEDPKEKKRKSYNMKNILKNISNITVDVNKKAIDLYNDGKMEEAATCFKNTFDLMNLNPGIVADTSLIQNQAICYQQAKEYQKALEVYKWLIDKHFTGVKKIYEAENIQTGKKESFPDKSQRDIYVKSGAYKNPNDSFSENQLPLMFKSAMSLCLLLEDYNQAEEIAKRGRNEFPEDKDMILYMGDIYYKQGKKEEFINILENAVSKDPTNKILYLNLGIVLGELKQNDKALQYYKKAIEIDSNYADAYFNTAVLILSGEQEINDKISKLGFSAKDKKKADELTNSKKDLYRKSIFYLEKAFELGKSNDINLVKTMKGIYYQLGDQEKMKKMKEKEDELSQK